MTLVDDLIWLIDIPSVTGDEQRLRNAIADRLGRSGIPTRAVGGSLVAGRGSGGPSIGLYGHLDAVPEQGNLPARLDGDRVHGLGASDMKAGLAVMIALLEDEAVNSGPFDLLAVFYDGEEGPAAGNGLRRVLDETPDLLGV